MDINLRCNSIPCRAVLDHFAVVTTCSHIFCTTCADSHLTAQAPSSRRPNSVAPTCPACRAVLENPDDIVKTNLNPPDDYKTSVLSGMSPTLILEIAGRAISFWTYQTNQEIFYQEHLLKESTRKFGILSSQLDVVLREANAKIADLENSLQALTIENETISRKNRELGDALRERSRRQLELQDKYDKFRRKSLMTHVQAVTGSANRPPNMANQPFGPPPPPPPPPPPLGLSNNNVRLDELNPALGRQNYQGNGGAGPLPFTERERLTIPSGAGNIERREGSISDGNSDGGRGVSSRSRIPMHGRIGSAGGRPWNTGIPRENIDGITTPMPGQAHRQRLVQIHSNMNNSNNGYAGAQNLELKQAQSRVGGVPRPMSSQRQALNGMTPNIGWSPFC
ncbi:hypothetical protein TWF730_000813 [Orbilia blumenaviensis]|uniref:RING-type domain-containing protein n=1 Tax=Orbilia blumenaviensis TaxID=1796055 RepID=A0AAV9VNZ9_9PEZI